MRAKEFIIEYKREVTLQKIGAGLAQSGKRENLTPDQVIEVLERIDPTPNKQYVLWLAKQYISGQFRTEDADRVRETLINFSKLKSRLPVEQRDIGRFDFYKLDELVDTLINPELSTKQNQTSPLPHIRIPNINTTKSAPKTNIHNRRPAPYNTLTVEMQFYQMRKMHQR